MDSPISDFEVGFWHPFGAHADEKPEDILLRKQKEIDTNGWTLGHFNIGKPCVVVEFLKDAKNVEVFCSNGKGKNTKSNPEYCVSYKPINEESFGKIPTGIEVPHPMHRRDRAGSAFIVERITIVNPDTNQDLNIEWVTKEGLWRDDKLPTRGEFMIRPGHQHLTRKFRAVLKLKYPFLAEIKADIS